MIRTIRAKFILGFFVIFTVFFLILNQWVTRNIEAGNRSTISDSLIDLKKNSNNYIRQSFLTHHFTSDEIYFEQIAEDMGTDLQHTVSDGVGMYSLAGELLYTSDKSIFKAGGDDLTAAMQGKTAYTIAMINGEVSILYAYPVVVNGTKVGIIRFAKDFTPLYEQSRAMKRTIFFIALAVFTAAFLFSYILSRHVTVPLVKLMQASNEVKDGNLHVRIAFKRKDEIGSLATNFSSMIEKLREQFLTIEKDRDRLEELINHRKRFFDNVTHELKTPLTTIMGYSEIILMNGAKDPVIFQKGMGHIMDESKRLHDMVLRLLEMSKASEGANNFERIDAACILRDVSESMAIKAKRYKKTIHCKASHDLFVYGQSDRLRQLFINLLDNAIKYSSAYSEIVVEAHLDAQAVKIMVTNEGETISPDNLKKIFEPYYRAGSVVNEEASAGLGLSISKSIVDEHQGLIRITSNNGQTSVQIELSFMEAERK
ncbi:signal transduction histidine kinase [Paenibacillus endophyticus]|uniref:histidine kinase n=1 Tax=Paenibacillus endophyticus TaxID=1294268 RepID=A0A7W5GAZ5_9BACL|nr:HAMP domain-containing sensor histidine kinase [Paenibacillus endophyticus]MBB3153251.1 signal transduction histidine kinase [Paenibacillus endophyticus]